MPNASEWTLIISVDAFLICSMRCKFAAGITIIAIALRTTVGVKLERELGLESAAERLKDLGAH